ncbi:MAG TPA: DUF11 domain-containing protein [Chloroflexi bacterium]|nr:DUF11 domain-containing protein [Chloroflexota bacterium]
MLHKPNNLKSLLIQTAIFVLAVVAGLWIGAWMLSVPPSKAANAHMPTFESPIGNPVLSLTKTVDDDAPQPGDQIQYTLTYSSTNPGSMAFNMRLYDFLPAGVQFVNSTPAATSYENGQLLFFAPSIGPTPQVATVRVRVLEGYERLRNYAVLTADEVTPTTTSLLTLVDQPPQYLDLSKTGYEAALIDGELVYTLRCENNSSAAVENATVADILPTGVSFVSASPTPDAGGTLPVLTWSLGTLPAGESRTIVVTTTAPSSAGVITNTAIAYGERRMPTYRVFATQVITEGAILKVTKQAPAGPVKVGDQIVYTIRYSNIGNQVATSVMLTDTLPPQIQVTGIYSTATLVMPSSPLVWSIGVITPGDPAGKVLITATITSGWGKTIHNYVELNSPDSYPASAHAYTAVQLARIYLPIVVRNYD